jgi:hypothetical protein
MIRDLILVPLAACAVYAQTKPSKDLQFWFNGCGIGIHTESSAADSPLSTAGSISVADGKPAHRIVVDRRDRPLFAYDISLAKAPQGGVLVSIRPLDQAQFRSETWRPREEIPADIPTIAAARDFPALQPGDAVQIDIMINPATGEKLWDVLRVIADPPPGSQQARLSPGERFSFERVKVAIDGKTISEPRNSWMIGKR